MECLITTLGERLANHQYFAKISKNYSTYNWTSSWKTKKRNGYQLSGKYTFTLKLTLQKSIYYDHVFWTFKKQTGI